MWIGKWRAFRMKAQVLNRGLTPYTAFPLTMKLCVCFCITRRCSMSSKSMSMFLFKMTERVAVLWQHQHQLAASVQRWARHRKQCDNINLSMDLGRGAVRRHLNDWGVLESKHNPPHMELPLKPQLEMPRWRENPAPVPPRALQEPVRAGPGNPSGISWRREPKGKPSTHCIPILPGPPGIASESAGFYLKWVSSLPAPRDLSLGAEN